MRYGYPYAKAKLAKPLRRLTQKISHGHPDATSTSQLIADVDKLRSLFHRTAATYEIKPYTGRITLFTLTQRDGMSDSLFDPALGYVNPFLGWDSVATLGVERYELEGEHTTILREPFVRALGEQLRQCLDREQLGISPVNHDSNRH